MKAHNLITSPADVLPQASESFKDPWYYFIIAFAAN